MKRKRIKIVSFMLMIMMVISMIVVLPAFAQANGKGGGNGKLTPTSLDNYPRPEIDITAANLLPLNGYFEQTVEVGVDKRKVKVYIPEGTPIRGFFTVITVPDGEETEKFLQTSGWLKIADERQEGLFILEAGKGGWGSFDNELNYVNAAMKKFGETTYYSTMGVYYIAGYGKGGAALQGWAVDNPLFVISQAYIHSDDLSTNYLRTTGAKEYGTDVEREGFDNVPYSEISVPTWIINKKLSSVKNTVDYWKTANDVVATSIKEKGPFNRNVYPQKKDSKAWPTQNSGPISKVVTMEQGIGETSNALTKSIYDFLSYYTRYDNTSVYGNSLGIRGSYDVNTIEMVEPDGRAWVREYITYVPTSYNGKKALPVVYALGGNTQTGRVFFEATQWWQVAEENDFIVVFPSSQYSSATAVTWNTNNTSTATMSNDFNFIKAVIEEIDETYNTDPSKRYVTGQSLGSSMAQRTSFYLADYFAAIGSTSFFVSSGAADGYNGIVPSYLIMGEKDNWPYDFTNVNSQPYRAVDYWTTRNKLNGVMDWSSYDQDGRYHNYIWNNKDGIPLYRYSWTEARSHNNIHAESEWLWNEWFSHWTMNEGQVRYYDGKAVDTNNGIVGLQAITDMRLLGQKLAAVAIEYGDSVDPTKLSLSSYEIKDLATDGENMAVSEISKAYTNNSPEMREDGQSIPGKYVILEIADHSNVGNMVSNYVYQDETGAKKIQQYWLKHDVNTTVKQLTDIVDKDGKVISKASEKEMEMTEKTVQLKFDEFEDLLTIPSSSGVDNIMVKYRLPKNYDSSKKYPIMMSLTGQGTSFWQVNGEDNFGTSLAMDPSAFAWMDEEDMIIVSTHYRSSVPASMSGKYNAADDIIATYEYFIENYSVDPDRVYITGNSMGTAKSFEVLMKRPDLVTAFIVANGAVNPGGSAYPNTRKDELKEELAEVARAGVALWFHHGLNDRSINIQRAQTAYQALLELHQENGRSEEWIKDNLKFTTYSNADFVVNGIDIGPPIYHSATKLAYNISFVSSWEDRLTDGERGIGISGWVRSKTK